MKRQIKFRVWDKTNKRMMLFDSYWPCDEYQSISWKINDKSKKESEGDYCLDWDERDLEIMQFTGLLDKNGVEIADGDVLIVEECHDSNIDHWNNKTQTPIPFEIKWEGCGFNVPYDYYYWKVIGNIYENPSLLEKTK